MKARLLYLVLLGAAVSVAYFFLVSRYVPQSWPWLLRIYAPPVVLCALLGYGMRIWQTGSAMTRAIAVLACLALPGVVIVGLISGACALDTGQCP